MDDILRDILDAFLLGMLIWAFASAGRARKHVAITRQRLGSYLPAHLVNDVLARSDHRPMAMIHTKVTVVVFRIRYFTNLVERLEPETALRYLNECYLLCGTAVSRNGGTIERLLEDGVVAVFGMGANEALDHEYRGIRAGLEAARLVTAMGNRWETEGRRPLRIAVGVNSGPIIAGDVGFVERRAFALVGSTVTIAHQLQDICEEINAAVVASAAVYAPVEARFVALPVKQMPLRHLNDLKDTFIIRGLSDAEPNDELRLPNIPALTTTIRTISEPGETENGAPVARIVNKIRRISPLAEDAQFRELDRDAPIVPDPIWPSTYEDDNGPPLSMRY